MTLFIIVAFEFIYFGSNTAFGILSLVKNNFNNVMDSNINMTFASFCPVNEKVIGSFIVTTNK